MVISIKDDSKTVTLDTLSLQCTEVLSEICDLMVAHGFASESVKEAVLTLAEEYEE